MRNTYQHNLLTGIRISSVAGECPTNPLRSNFECSAYLRGAEIQDLTTL